ncbi:hypothetical protein [Streptomyces sp. NPDC054838]
MRPQDTLPPELERCLLDVLIACPDIARACDLAAPSPSSSATDVASF